MKATIYSTSEFFGSVIKREVVVTEIGRDDYAQYSNAPYIIYVPKGKRKHCIQRALSYPYLLVIEGWNHPEPQDFMTEPIKESSGVSVSHSRYSSFDERFKTEFDNIINPYIEDKKVIMGIRQTAGKEVINEYNKSTSQTSPA